MKLTVKQQKVLVFKYGNIDKYENLTGEKTLPSDRVRMIKQAMFPSSSSGKKVRKTNKNN